MRQTTRDRRTHRPSGRSARHELGGVGHNVVAVLGPVVVLHGDGVVTAGEDDGERGVPEHVSTRGFPDDRCEVGRCSEPEAEHDLGELVVRIELLAKVPHDSITEFAVELGVGDE